MVVVDGVLMVVDGECHAFGPVFKCFFFVIFQLYCRSSHLYQVMSFERCDHNRSY